MHIHAFAIVTTVKPLLTIVSPDQYQISPCNINAYSTPEIMGIKDIFSQSEFSCYLNNFSPVLL